MNKKQKINKQSTIQIIKYYMLKKCLFRDTKTGSIKTEALYSTETQNYNLKGVR